jgi:hypothetical protein
MTPEQQAANPMANDFEAAKVLLEEWKWRHQHCWKSLNRYGLTAITVGLVPYVWLLKESPTPSAGTVNLLKEKIGNGVAFFPLFALIIAQAAVWVFASEYVRCRPVEAMYNRVLGTYSANVPAKELTPSWGSGVARNTIFIFGMLAALLALIDVCLLVYVADLKIYTDWIRYLTWVGIVLVIVATIVFDWKLANWSSVQVGRRIDVQPAVSHRTVNGDPNTP